MVRAKRSRAVKVCVEPARKYRKAGEAVAPTPSPETPIKKPEQIENGWRRSAEILSKAELSNPNPRSRKLAEKLSHLEAGTMFVQLCNLEAILQISRSEQEYRPEGIIAYAMSDLATKGDIIIANGAAFQSKGQWYNLSFRCRVSPTSRTVQGFEFAIGSAIPKSDWASHNLPRQSIGLAEDESG